MTNVWSKLRCVDEGAGWGMWVCRLCVPCGSRQPSCPSVAAASFCLSMLIMLIIRSFVCLSWTRTCREMAWMAQQRNNAGGRERPQRCWATRTTGVRDVSSSVKNVTPVKLTLAAVAYMWRPQTRHACLLSNMMNFKRVIIKFCVCVYVCIGMSGASQITVVNQIYISCHCCWLHDFDSLYAMSQKTVHFRFCQNFVKFSLTLISFGR